VIAPSTRARHSEARITGLSDIIFKTEVACRSRFDTYMLKAVSAIRVGPVTGNGNSRQIDEKIARATQNKTNKKFRFLCLDLHLCLIIVYMYVYI
jgi:hypothetical protein